MWKSQGERSWRMLKFFPAKSLKLILHQIASMGKGFITKAENYKLRFPISSGAPCALANFIFVQQCFEMSVRYLVTSSYKPVQTTSLNICRSMFLQ